MKNVFLNALLVIGTCFVMFLGFEIGLRIHDKIPLTAFNNFVYEKVSLLSLNTFARYDEEIGWVIASNLRERGANWQKQEQTFTTNEMGFRMNSDQVVPTPEGAILASGDSFTVGSEASDEETWPAWLEQMIGKRVINVAGGGWATDQIILQAERMAEKLNPHTIIISFLWDDIIRSEFKVYAGGHKPYFDLVDGQLVRKNETVPLPGSSMGQIGVFRQILGYSYFVTWTAKLVGFKKWIGDWNLQYQRANPEGSGVAITNHLLDRFKTFCDERNIRPILVMQYSSVDNYKENKRPVQAVEVLEHAQKLEIETVDPWKAIQETYARDMDEFRSLWSLQADGKTLGHMSGIGNQLIAEEISKTFPKTP